MATIVGFCMELLRMVLLFTRPISDKILDTLYRIIMGKTKPLPAIDDKILLLSATDIASLIRKRKIRVETVMTAYIKRIKAVEPLINAFTDQRFEDALEEAKGIDRKLQTTDMTEEQILKETPLLGVPFTCKESVGVAGLAMTRGLVKYKNRKAPSDSETVALYRKAGAIPVTVTNVPVNCMWWESANQAFGMTRNPYDNRRTVGGSSGGEGAIITSGGALFGIGTDLAGSIRIPSSFCGIYGHKPSRGIISNQIPWSPKPGADMSFLKKFLDYVSTGPMCRYVQDLPLLTKILAGDDVNKLSLDKQVNFRHVKIYYLEEFPGCLLQVTPDIKSAVRKAVNHFQEQYGTKAIKLRIEEFRDAFSIWECKLLETGMPSFKSMLSAETPGLNLWIEFLKSLLQCSEYTWPALYFAAVDRRDKDKSYYECLDKFIVLRFKLESIFKEDAILLLPTHPEPPPHYLMTIPKYPNIAYTCIFNIMGYPSSQIPTGLSKGLPIGIQAVSSMFKDHLTLATAVELDKVFKGWMCPCPITI